ncbi:mitotic spindle checkpoint protein Bub3 [Malassezia equina]|uniref:Mitotic spindle checkpoint protein Bub3 n=1 Tax=Malassezia equina TaxID=1381935 RepID=A0AAF0EBZ3_9BASI|nr:mitotic spindle checkpoint protein Bub3 [Malassezia equina]
MQPVFAEFCAPQPPQEPVSALAFLGDAQSKRAFHLLVSSWDKFVRLYDLSRCAQGADAVHVLRSFEHPAAVLYVTWINETLAASACLDRRVRLLNMETGQMVILGKHDNGVCRVCFDPHTHLLFSGSWDATVKVWDPFGDPANALKATLTMPGKVFAMDVSPPSSPLPAQLIVAMSERAVYVYNTSRLREALNGPHADSFEPEQRRESSLKFMLRDVKSTPDGTGYVTSSVEGRVAVEFLETSETAQAQKYAFKCHRKEVDGVDVVYPIHAVAFHPVYGTFATCGGDAHCALWDPIAKKRIRQYTLPSPVSTACFSADGSVLVIASGAENMEDTHHPGPDAGEVGGMGAGGPGRVLLHIKPATDDAKPKAKPA